MKAERWKKMKKTLRKPLLLLFAASLITSLLPLSPNANAADSEPEGTIAHYPLNSAYQYKNKLNEAQTLSGDTPIWRTDYVSLVNPGANGEHKGHIAGANPGPAVTGDKIAFSFNVKNNSVQTRTISAANSLFGYGNTDNNITLRPYYANGTAAVVLKRNGTDEVVASFPAPAADMWHNYTISVDGTPSTGQLVVWVDGVQVQSVSSKGIGADEIINNQFRLNRTLSGFLNLDAHYRNVRVFNNTVNSDIAVELANETRSFAWNDLLASIPFADGSEVRNNLALLKDPNISWTSSKNNVINAATGVVTRPSSTEEVTLTLNWFSLTKSYTVIVPPPDAGDMLIANFNFDDATTGLQGGGAKATVQGTASYGDSFEGNGKAANLSSSFWLNVTKTDGTPLLAGLDEITISYDSKSNADPGWTIFAATNTSAQTHNSERYLGILDQPSKIVVERYNNSGSRPQIAETASSNAWKHIDVVVSSTDTKLYVNNQLKATVPSSHSLSSIVSQTGGILQLGKGNWGGGEYFNGLIDNVQIFNKALSLEQLTDFRLTNVSPTISPAAGQIYTPVTITHPTGIDYIYYTTDGSDPTLSSSKYTGPFTVSKGTVVKTAAIAPNGKSSSVRTVEYYGSQWAATALAFRLQGEWSVNNAKISWPVIPGTDYYEVYRGETLIDRVRGDVVDDYGLDIDASFSYRVKAIRGSATIAEATTNAIETFTYDPSAVTRVKNNYTGEDGFTAGQPNGVKVGGTWYHYTYKAERNSDTGIVTTSIYEFTSTDGIQFGNERLLESFEDMRVEMEGYRLNPATGKIVFVAHEEASSGYGRGAVFLGSMTPGGNDFEDTFRGHPLDHDSRDMSMFVDDDNTAYLVFATNTNSDLAIVKLNASWTQPVELVNTIFRGKHKESPVIIKHDGRYYFFGSTASGWYPSQAEYASADTLGGEWTPLRPIANGATFATQANGVKEYAGTDGKQSFVLNGYHWGNQHHAGFQDPMGTYARLFPMVFNNGIATAEWFKQLDLDPVRGLIPVQSGQYISLNKNASDSQGLNATAATDGADLASSPQLNHATLPYSVVVDLEQASQLSEINFTTRLVGGSDTVFRYTLSGSQDNQNWTQLVDGSQNNVVGFVTNPISNNSPFRYVRLTVNSIKNVHNGNDAVWADGLIELAVFGTPDVNKSLLEAKYNEKKDTVKGTYANSTWNKIVTALNNAEAVLANQSASQWKVDRAALQIDEAFRWALTINEDKIVDYTEAGVPVGETWYDTEGNAIQAHGGGFLQQTAADGKPIYYWVGENKIHNSAVFHAVSLYSSRDLVNWVNEGDIVDQFTQTVPGAEFGLLDNKWERPKLLYNEKTQKYVLYGHWETANSYASSQIAVATADQVNGPYTFLGHWRPGGTLRNWRSDGGNYLDSEFYKTSGVKTTIPSDIQNDENQMGKLLRDYTVFMDDDGKAYLVNAEGHSMRVHRLNEEFTDVDFTTYVDSDPATKATDFESYLFYDHVGREAPAIVRAENGYYMATSGQSGWFPNQTMISYTTDLKDPNGWTPVKDNNLLIPGYTLGNNSTFYSQPTNIMRLVDSNGNKSFVYMGDRWRASQLSDSRYVWLPMTLDEAKQTASMTYTTGWKLNAEDGSVQLPQTYLVSRGKSSTITGNTDVLKDIAKANDGIAYSLSTSGDSTDYFGGLVGPYEYTIDLGDKYDLSRIDVAYRLYNGSEMYHKYRIHASNDGQTWTQLYDGTANNWVGFNSSKLDGRYRYVKLEVVEVRRANNNALSNNWGSGLVEVEVYAKSPDAFVLTPPTADSNAGTYDYPKKVKLSHPVDGARIYYTLDGSDPSDVPSDTNKLYTGPIALPIGETTIKALAVVDGESSQVIEIPYVVVLDLSVLSNAIDSAQALHDAAVEGTLIGQYAEGSKATLQAAIDSAKPLLSEVSPELSNIEATLLQLLDAIQAFKALVVLPPKGDLNGDGHLGTEDLRLLVSIYYGKSEANSDWELYKAADWNGDGIIDIEDLRGIAKQIQNPIPNAVLNEEQNEIQDETQNQVQDEGQTEVQNAVQNEAQNVEQN
ncbi:chitobiase/beta-hexosaminidase C-terminal domain-containing protein [Paenibacillus sp. CAU 1782]